MLICKYNPVFPLRCWWDPSGPGCTGADPFSNAYAQSRQYEIYVNMSGGGYKKYHLSNTLLWEASELPCAADAVRPVIWVTGDPAVLRRKRRC